MSLQEWSRNTKWVTREETTSHNKHPAVFIVASAAAWKSSQGPEDPGLRTAPAQLRSSTALPVLPWMARAASLSQTTPITMRARSRRTAPSARSQGPEGTVFFGTAPAQLHTSTAQQGCRGWRGQFRYRRQRQSCAQGRAGRHRQHARRVWKSRVCGRLSGCCTIQLPSCLSHMVSLVSHTSICWNVVAWWHAMLWFCRHLGM
jgi:hypothetical protein